MNLIDLEDKSLPSTSSEGSGKRGGISITHSGTPGGLLACGMLLERETGFSSHFTFEDPAASRSQVLAGAHLLIGKPDLSGFPGESSFTSIALLRNASESAIEVKPSVSFSLNGQARAVSLSPRVLDPNQIQALDVGAELKRLGIRGGVTGSGLTLSSSGQPGGLVAHLTSFDQTRNHVFDVPLKDPGVAANRLSGSYPWSIEDDYQSVIHVRSTTDEKARFTIQLDFDGGSYTLPLQVVDAQQEVAIDIRGLRDSQTKDSIGRVIPMEVTHGQATWSERGRQALIGRVEVFSVGRGTSSSLSCGGPCCPPDTESICVTPDAFSGVVGEGGAAHAYEMQERDCDGAQFGPFEITFQSQWSSSNSQVVALNGSDFTCVGEGVADVSVSYIGTDFLGSELNEICELAELAFFASCPVTVRTPHHLKVLSDSTTTMSCGSLRRDITYQVVDISGNQTRLTATKELFQGINCATNTCQNKDVCPSACSTDNADATFTDVLRVGCPSTGGNCGFDVTSVWQWCPAGHPAVMLATLDYKIHHSSILVNGLAKLPVGTEIFP